MFGFSDGRRLPAPSRADRDIQIASKGHCTAYAVLGNGADDARRVQAESYLELCHLMFLNSLLNYDMIIQVVFHGLLQEQIGRWKRRWHHAFRR